MKIGIDISQLAYPETGVANYLENLVQSLVDLDSQNSYVLFFSSLRGKLKTENLKLKNNPNVQIKTFRIPPTVLDIIWNKLHILPIESLIGDVDVFITSDWTEPPAKKAKKVTILYDLIVYKYPKETAEKIVAVQKRKLKWVKKESQRILCISEATKKDAEEILGIDKNKLSVVYPGFSL
jgi:hypothetical protein